MLDIAYNVCIWCGYRRPSKTMTHSKTKEEFALIIIMMMMMMMMMIIIIIIIVILYI